MNFLPLILLTSQNIIHYIAKAIYDKKMSNDADKEQSRRPIKVQGTCSSIISLMVYLLKSQLRIIHSIEPFFNAINHGFDASFLKWRCQFG